MRKIDLTGQKFGRLTVLAEAEPYISPKGVKLIRYKCLCDCGNTTVVSGNLLKRGHTTSCGCFHKEQQKNQIILTPKDITGQRFGTLTAIRYVGSNDKNLALWECRCDCGATIIAVGARLRSGHTKSCGDRSKHAYKHGACCNENRERLFKVYTDIKQRCTNPNNHGYKDYGGRGITVCQSWLNDYCAFRDWAYANGYKEEVLPNGVNIWTIERIDVNGNYCPENCTWITTQEQQFNKRDNVILTYNGETMTATEWAQKLKISPHIIWTRLKSGWSIEETLNTPKLRSPHERHKLVVNA